MRRDFLKQPFALQLAPSKHYKPIYSSMYEIKVIRGSRDDVDLTSHLGTATKSDI